jgi:dihydroorotate dehydrogenase
MKKYFKYLILIFSVIGIADAAYLTWEHYANIIPPCSIHWWISDCGKVLTSSYSKIFGIPLALIGLIFYFVEFILTIFLFTNKRIFKLTLLTVSFIGFVSSLYFVFLMLIVIRAICWYCLGSAATSTLIFLITWSYLKTERIWLSVIITKYLYKYLFKPIFFRIDPEKIHVFMINFGNRLGKSKIVTSGLTYGYKNVDTRLTQNIRGIKFSNPIGLAAGFDYEAKLTQILSPLNFGFQTVGTITNRPYEGNPPPILGRLPLSQSLLVNKGFKNLGSDTTIKYLSNQNLPIPTGISIGRTNSRSQTLTQKQSVEDICIAFEKFEKSNLNHSYYELNISCPNLNGNISFYPPQNLKELLTETDKLHLRKPVFIKMPIEKSDAETLEMLKIIADHKPIGVIIGNLQKNRRHKDLNQQEVNKFPTGFFSGKPTFSDSNRLIELTYKNYKNRFVIIGCGGVFSGRDAYEKIIRGASLIELITGMIYEGPQLVSQINLELLDILDQNGYKNISDAIGTKINI